MTLLLILFCRSDLRPFQFQSVKLQCIKKGDNTGECTVPSVKKCYQQDSFHDESNQGRTVYTHLLRSICVFLTLNKTTCGSYCNYAQQTFVTVHVEVH